MNEEERQETTEKTETRNEKRKNVERKEREGDRGKRREGRGKGRQREWKKQDGQRPCRWRFPWFTRERTEWAHARAVLSHTSPWSALAT